MNKIPLHFSRGHVDSFGASLSIICAVHCMAVPMLIAVLPFWGMQFLATEGFGHGMMFSSLLLATASLCWGYRLHRKWRGIVALAGGAMMIFAGQSLTVETYETAFVTLGAACLVTAHLINRRLCNRCSSCQFTELGDGPGGNQ